MSDAPLSEDVLAQVAALEVLDASSTAVKFGSIYEAQKTVVVFVRHLYCGRCQDYTTALASVREDALRDADTQIVVIGCGEPSAILKYREFTGFRGAIYADPALALYRTLNLDATLRRPTEDEPARAYIEGGFLKATAASIGRIIANPANLGKQGPWAQLGGEFILGPGQKCSFAYRMKHSEDHTDVSDLMLAAGVAFP